MKNSEHSHSYSLLTSVKNFFSKEPLWKLFSLAAAVFMWFIVMNIINPTEVKTFQANISLENMSSITDMGYMISNIEEIEDYSVSVKVEATRPALDELSKSENRENIKARLDLSKIEIQENDEFPKKYTVALTPSIPSNLYIYNFDISNYYPTVCQVEIDRAATKTVPVEITTYGSPDSGYTAETPVSGVDEVVVTGPQHNIFNAAKAVATVDITGQNADITQNCELTVCDEDGNALEGFAVEPESINVRTAIRKNHTVDINEPRTTGSLPDYLELVSIDWTPKTIDVTSDNEKAVESITLPPVDLSDIRETTITSVDISGILENAGLETEASNRKVNVTVNVKLKSGGKYVIPAENIKITGLGQGLEAEVTNDVTIEVGGVDNINVNSLMPQVNVTGLGEGKHSVSLGLNLPEGAVMDKEPTADVNIAGIETEQPQQQETETVTETSAEDTTEEVQSESASEENEE